MLCIRYQDAPRWHGWRLQKTLCFRDRVTLFFVLYVVLHIQVSKRFNLCTATSFDDPRLTLVHEDAAEFVKREVRLPGRVLKYMIHEFGLWNFFTSGDTSTRLLLCVRL